MVVRRRVTRRNLAALPWIRALAFAAVVLAGSSALPFYPLAVSSLIALGTAAVALAAPAVAVLVVIVALAIPLMAADMAFGIAFLLLGLVSSAYLGQNKARAFLFIALAFVAASFKASWALAVIAGYALGAGEGAVVAFIACLGIEAFGLFAGRETVGVLTTGGTVPGALDLTSISADGVTLGEEVYRPLGFAWLGPAFSRLGFGELLEALTDAKEVALLVGQPIVWAAAAAVTGAITRPAGDRRRIPSAILASLAGLALVAVVSIGVMAALGGGVSPESMAVAALASLPVTLAFVAASELLFAPEIEEIVTESVSMRAEDADVDSLLRVISSAEDQLATDHTVRATVLMTDMKSFSHITEQDGSYSTAKMIQRQRDIILPVLERYGGSGKSTGGDGMLAAFEHPADALSAAVGIQKALAAHNSRHAGERDITVRVGVDEGEVVIDRAGRPFIGDALNRAARIMDLADGGQILASAGVVERSGQTLPAADHGPRRVKNIAEPIRIVEVLWHDGQQPRAPRVVLPVQEIAPPQEGPSQTE